MSCCDSGVAFKGFSGLFSQAEPFKLCSSLLQKQWQRLSATALPCLPAIGRVGTDTPKDHLNISSLPSHPHKQ